MLSYRHEFHAGSVADLLKHSVLSLVIEYLKQKPAPIRYIDTHAGAGLYAINSARAQKTGEYNRGVGRLALAELPAPLAPYAAVIRPYVSEQQYPGSPLIAAKLLRAHDEIRLFELHSSDYPELQELFANDKRVRVANTDGYKSTTALLPVSNARAIVLIDPSYELSSDYEDVTVAVRKGYERMPNAVFLIWYPVVNNPQLSKMIRHMGEVTDGKFWRYELALSKVADHKGMTATGMLAINPPWTLGEELEASFSVLCPLLDHDNPALTIECLKT